MELHGKPLNQGKTQNIFPLMVIQQARDDITASDGKKRAQISGKAELSTTTSCNNFRLLKERGVPVAFKKQLDPTSFSALHCDMFTYEVVGRREVRGSNFPPRRPDLKVGHRFDEPLIEFFLKTKGQRWKDHNLGCDDPLMRISKDGNSIALFIPNKPEEKPFLTLRANEVFTCDDELELIKQMETLMTKSFLILESAWSELGVTLADIKLEFGLDVFRKLRLADVADGDSGRFMYEGTHVSKEAFRQGEPLDDVSTKLMFLAEMSEKLK